VASREQNRAVWEDYDWAASGEEWSAVWGGVRTQWWACLYPRLSRYLPAPTVLEIAAGAGRFSQFLVPLARRLILVDLAPRCVELCRQRFAGLAHVECHENDGRTLPFVADGSVDFALSIDSLVHVDLATIVAYVAELARVLTPDGVAFLHHSNFGAYVDPATGLARIPNPHWRDESVTAVQVRAAAAERGLAPLVQEEVNWGAREQLTDCFSLLTRQGSRHEAPLLRAENPHFMDEAVRLAQLMALWNPDGPDYRKLPRDG
jgi:SAM-dependent methyltransferase